MKAFTLVEITITIIVLAVLAAIALPNFSSSMERMRIREGITALQTVRSAWKDFELQTGSSSNVLANLDITVPTLKNFGTLTLSSASSAILLGNCSNPCLDSNAWVASMVSSGSIAYPLLIQIDGTIVCGNSGDSSFDAICNTLGLPIQIP